MKIPVKLFRTLTLGGMLLYWGSLHAQDQPERQWSDVESEIVRVERSFQLMTVSEGIAQAFKHFAAPNAVLNRNNILIRGRDSIFSFYNKPVYHNAQVNWSPESVTVSKSEDLAQSYGSYTWTVIGKDGSKKVSNGIFMTVWQRQPDGSWKYIWD